MKPSEQKKMNEWRERCTQNAAMTERRVTEEVFESGAVARIVHGTPLDAELHVRGFMPIREYERRFLPNGWPKSEPTRRIVK